MKLQLARRSVLEGSSGSFSSLVDTTELYTIDHCVLSHHIWSFHLHVHKNLSHNTNIVQISTAKIPSRISGSDELVAKVCERSKQNQETPSSLSISNLLLTLSCCHVQTTRQISIVS